MPSYRVTMSIGALHGVADAVLPAARAATVEVAVLEASDLQVARGEARVVVRFTTGDPEIATQVGRHVAAGTAVTAQVTGWHLTQRVGSRWEPLGLP